MKLDEYVKQSLLDITNGVARAQNETLLYVAPGFVENEKKTEPQMVKFEVPVYFQAPTERTERPFSKREKSQRI